MAQYTKKAILHTFTQMLTEMPLDRITVSALVARCQISPNTFYYHYRDLSDLLNAWLSTAMEPFFSAGAEHWQENLIALLNAMKQRPEIVYHVCFPFPGADGALRLPLGERFLRAPHRRGA